MTTHRDKKTLSDLLAVMAALRTPDTGCPWDLAQTFETIAPYTIEEAYEVADAIARGDMADLKDELGDLLLQVVYQSQIASEAQHFTFADVADAITTKMIRRHPHVFGNADERAAGAAPGFWERIKADERASKNNARVGQGTPPLNSANDAKASILSDVPVGLPGLTRAIKLQDKAAHVGFDWPDINPVFAKLTEEIAELEGAVASKDQTEIEGELGDLLFVIANLARHLKVDPEAALRATNAKFTRRFAHIEASLAAQGRTPDQSDLAEMDRLWNDAKAIEKSRPNFRLD
jgi:nucleoside triphosphate diphosphatase